jgi:hypothetical protein
MNEREGCKKRYDVCISCRKTLRRYEYIGIVVVWERLVLGTCQNLTGETTRKLPARSRVISGVVGPTESNYYYTPKASLRGERLSHF